MLREVTSEVDEVTEHQITLTFEDFEMGWYSITVESALFVNKPVVGSRVDIELEFSPTEGITRFIKILGLSPPLVKPVTTKLALPPEPLDYDDPKQFRLYEEQLRRHFHVPAE